MSRDVRKLVDQIRRQAETPSRRSFHQGVVLSSDPDNGTAQILIGSEDVPEASATIQVFQQNGFLPAVGETVMVQMNGADPFVTTARHLVDGDMQSKEFDTGVAGWRITSEGDAEFNDVLVRGYVNNIKVHQPPLALLRSKAADYPLSIPDATWTTLTDLEITLSNAAGPSGNSAYGISYATSGSRVTPGRVGLWQVTAKVNWDFNGAGTLRRLQLVNDTLSSASDLDIRGPQGGLVMHNVHEPVEVSDISHQYSLRVYQDSGGSLDVDSVKWLWEFKSD